MREIKFRIWCKQNETMKTVSKIGFDEGKLWYVEDEDHETQPPYFEDDDDWVLMQYTGLKDKNGKEIFEGDIVTGKGIQGVIKWIPEHCGFLIHEEIGYTFINAGNAPETNYEIIGNIYENPELLGGAGE